MPPLADGVEESVYALAMNKLGSIVAVGSTEAAVRIVDARTGDKVAQGVCAAHSDVQVAQVDDSVRDIHTGTFFT